MDTHPKIDPPPRIHMRNVLLVGNPYDAFLLEEAGFRPPGQVEPSDAPAFELVRSGAAALKALELGGYDMVMADYVLPDTMGVELARKIRQSFPTVPVVVVTSNTDLGGAAVGSPGRQEPNLFIWYGAHSFLRAVVRLQKDEKNAPLLVAQGHALAILLVEDEPNFYSHFVPLLYERIEASAMELIPPARRPVSTWGVIANRPLVLLRRNFEDACEVLYRYRGQLLAVITDMCFPVQGELKGDAGLRILYRARAVNAHIPVAVHSREVEHREAAHEADAKFLWKDSPHFLPDLDHFLVEFCGFGPFVFRWPAGEVYGVAHNLAELRALIADVPEVVFEHHALHSDFSTWLAVHGYQDLARQIRDQSITNPTVRQLLLDAIDAALHTNGAPSILDKPDHRQ
jgi:CheY-like chemotaxis protein